MSNNSDLLTLTTRCDYNAAGKKAFHRVAAKYLKRLERGLSGMYGGGGLRHNQGGIAVSGEITLHLEKLYVQVSQYSFGPANRVVMFRECDGLKDYTGKHNYYADAEMLLDTERLGRYIQERCTSTQPRA